MIAFYSKIAVEWYGAFQRWKKTHLDLWTIVSQKKEQEWNLYIFHGLILFEEWLTILASHFYLIHEERERLESGLFKWMKKWNWSILILHFQFSYWQKALLSLFLCKRKSKIARLNLVHFLGTLLFITLSTISLSI